MRLANSSVAGQGIVEVCVNGVWGTVCNKVNLQSAGSKFFIFLHSGWNHAIATGLNPCLHTCST